MSESGHLHAIWPFLGSPDDAEKGLVELSEDSARVHVLRFVRLNATCRRDFLEM